MGKNGNKGLRRKNIGTSYLVVSTSSVYFFSFGLCRLLRIGAIRVQDVISSQWAQVHLLNVYLELAANVV